MALADNPLRILETPQRCRQCARLSGGIVCDCCTFCDDVGLDEIVLCDLNREDQEHAEAFHCRAFQPVLNAISLDFHTGETVNAGGDGRRAA